MNRNQIQVKSVEGDLWDQTEVVAHFKTWKARHNFVAGVEGGQEISNPTRYSYSLKPNATSPAINTVPTATLLHPDEDQPFAGTGYITSIVHAKSKSVLVCTSWIR